MMLKKNLFLLLALFTLMINSHASIQHDLEHHYHHEEENHDGHTCHHEDDTPTDLNTSNCEKCLLEHSITEAGYIHVPENFTYPNASIFYSALFTKSILSKIFLVYQSRAP